MRSGSLLPPNATALERNAARATARIERVPVPLRTLWNPATCPANLLPFLAWAFSVDRWDPAWPLATKRAVTANSYFVHRKKGTIGALRRVVEPVGYLIRVIEWHQTTPPGVRGTFALDIGVLDTGITEGMYDELERLIDDTKPLTRHLTGLAIAVKSRGAVCLVGAAALADALTVYPCTPTEVTAGGAIRAASATHAIETLTVHP